MRCGIKLNHIPFSGGGPAVTALLGGHIDCYVGSVTTVGPHINPEGGLRILTVFGRERLSYLPDVPTCFEKGYDIDRGSFYYLAAPKGTPRTVLEILAKVLKKTADDPQAKEALVKLGYIPLNLGQEETVKQVRQEFEVAGKIFKRLGLSK